MHYSTLKVKIIYCTALTPSPAAADLFKDSKGGLELRNFYYNRDFRSNGAAQSKRDEWAQGFIINLQPGYTDGVNEIGIDYYVNNCKRPEMSVDFALTEIGSRD